MPCVHIGTDMSYMDFYLKHTDYVALGGIALVQKRDRVDWLNGIFSKYDCKFHGFGVQDVSILKRYPWHSVDASSWHLRARVGWICTPWGTFLIADSGNYEKYPTPMKSSHHEKVVRGWIAGFGIDLDACRKSDSDGSYWRSVVNLLFYENLSEEIGEVKFKKRRSIF